jgi:hypothetical protein
MSGIVVRNGDDGCFFASFPFVFSIAITVTRLRNTTMYSHIGWHLFVTSAACAIFVTGTLIVACTTFACLYAAANAVSVTDQFEESQSSGEHRVLATTDAVSGDDWWQLLLAAEEEGLRYEDRILAERTPDD